MAATPLASSTRYYVTGTRQVYWVPSIASKAAPTRSELDAGTDLTGEINAMAGFDPTSATVDTPDLASRFTSQIPGAITVSASTITLYTSEDSQDARQIMPRDTAGFIVVFWEGDVAANLMDVFPVRVTAAPKDVTTTDAGMITINFAVTSEPAENVTIPA
jgi:hypothetical protein